ncbi:hypothetical protein X975_26494, partial [Stegodyphus mimosarum]
MENSVNYNIMNVYQNHHAQMALLVLMILMDIHAFVLQDL